jgi:hypothetical protein
MTRTPQQAKHLDSILDQYDHAGDATELVSQAAFEMIHGLGMADDPATFEAATAGVSWLQWWVDMLAAKGDLTRAERAKMTGVIQMGASVWATNARTWRANEAERGKVSADA